MIYVRVHRFEDANVFIDVCKDSDDIFYITYSSKEIKDFEPEFIHGGEVDQERAVELAEKFFQMYRKNSKPSIRRSDIPLKEELATLTSKDELFKVTMYRELNKKENEEPFTLHYEHVTDNGKEEKKDVIERFRTEHDGEINNVYESTIKDSYGTYRDAFLRAQLLVTNYENKKRMKETSASVLKLKAAAVKYIGLVEANYMLKQHLKQVMERSLKVSETIGITKAEEIWLLSYEAFVKNIMQHKVDDHAAVSDTHTFYIESTVFNAFIKDSNALFDEIRANIGTTKSSREQSVWYSHYLSFAKDVEVQNKGLLNDHGWDIR